MNRKFAQKIASLLYPFQLKIEIALIFFGGHRNFTNGFRSREDDYNTFTKLTVRSIFFYSEVV